VTIHGGIAQNKCSQNHRISLREGETVRFAFIDRAAQARVVAVLVCAAVAIGAVIPAASIPVAGPGEAPVLTRALLRKTLSAAGTFVPALTLPTTHPTTGPRLGRTRVG
jgi:hypothetical protein